ncbi:MAG: class I SAM-dependent methyltransferase [Chloroflexi bacterium]|nr:class I SAM-dependent methyltransferase [Chloroflexota bacterium]
MALTRKAEATSVGDGTTIKFTAASRKLNLGSGMKPVAGAINIDRVGTVPADIQHDLNAIPWPLPDSHFDEVYCTDVLEHLANLVAVMEEIHRVARPGCKVSIVTPHYSCANSFTDPTHLHHLGYFSFDYFTGDTKWDYYTSRQYRYLKRQLIFYPTMKNRLLRRLANRQPAFYERHLAWLLPAWFVWLELGVVK